MPLLTLASLRRPHSEINGDSHNGLGREYNFCVRYVWTNLLYITNFYPDQFKGAMKMDKNDYAHAVSRPYVIAVLY